MIRQVVRRRAAMALALVLALVVATSASGPTTPHRDDRIAGPLPSVSGSANTVPEAGNPTNATVDVSAADPTPTSAAPTVSASVIAGAPPVAAPAERVAHAQAPALTASTTGTGWGVAGGYPAGAFTQMRANGATFALLELAWQSAEPQLGSFDEGYFASVRAEVAAMRSAGLDVVLSDGMYLAPDWLLSMPNARFVDQSGATYTATPEANLVWATNLRTYASAYLQKVFAELGSDFLAVRAGGGTWDELSYPRTVNSNGSSTNSYWAFDAAAAQSDPVPGWKPGDPSPAGQASTFLSWYLNGLVNFQNWQIAAIRSHYSGTIAVLYPSWGMRGNDFAAAVAQNLSGHTPPESNGDVPAGIDHSREVLGLTDKDVALWCTWADQTLPNLAPSPPPIAELSALATRTGRLLMGENTGNQTNSAALARMTQNVTKYKLRLVMWVRFSNLANSQGVTFAQFKSSAQG